MADASSSLFLCSLFPVLTPKPVASIILHLRDYYSLVDVLMGMFLPIFMSDAFKIILGNALFSFSRINTGFVAILTLKSLIVNRRILTPIFFYNLKTFSVTNWLTPGKYCFDIYLFVNLNNSILPNKNQEILISS